MASLVWCLRVRWILFQQGFWLGLGLRTVWPGPPGSRWESLGVGLSTRAWLVL